MSPDGPGETPPALLPHLRKLAALRLILERPDVDFGDWAPVKEIEPGVYQMPYVLYSEVAESVFATVADFVAALPPFDWMDWLDTEEAAALREDEAVLARATALQLWKVATVRLRSVRFCDGSFLDTLKSGLVLRISRPSVATSRTGFSSPEISDSGFSNSRSRGRRRGSMSGAAPIPSA